MSNESTVLEFTGTLTRHDVKTYLPHTFEVPEGITNIHINFQFSPRYATGRIHRNQINISVNDPDGIRGVFNVVREEGLDINGIASSPGFGSWPVQPGKWTVFVDVHRILPPDTVNYEINVTLSRKVLTVTLPEYPEAAPVAASTPGWYRGDLHAHTIHSDGSWDIPEFTTFMRSLGLDFVTLSDHNSITGLKQHRSQTTDGFLAMGGIELSTFNGHMLALGSSHWYEWRLGIRDGIDIHHIMQQVIDQGDMLIIAHPMSPDEPFCSGCMWAFEDARPGVALGVEIWNGFWHIFNDEGLQQYYLWLNQGHRLVATSGTDIHSPHDGAPNQRRRAGFNVVYAQELSESAILQAIRQGHSYISAGPELLLTAQSETGGEAMCGDMLKADQATIRATWKGAHPDDVLGFVVDGEVREQISIAESGEQSWELRTDEASWCTVEMRDSFNDMWAVSNPIFLRKGEPDA